MIHSFFDFLSPTISGPRSRAEIVNDNHILFVHVAISLYLFKDKAEGVVIIVKIIDGMD